VGFGINETLRRNEHPDFALTVQELYWHTADRLRAIRDIYLPRRVQALGIPSVDPVVLSDEVLDRFIAESAMMFDSLGLTTTMPEAEHYVFEGAQGLQLDELSPNFPYVTPSRPGLPYVLELIDPPLEVYYVSRSYVTRHGAGPLPGELPEGQRPFPGIVDRTNIPNPWQGSLRFAPFDPAAFTAAVQADLAHADRPVTPHVVLSCMDQGAVPDDVQQQVCTDIGAASLVTSYGPEATDFQEVTYASK
jgi:adenylosuccinate synthase